MLVSVSCAEKPITVPITSLTDDEIINLYFVSEGIRQNVIDIDPIIIFVVKTLKEVPDFDLSDIYEGAELTLALDIKDLMYEYIENGVPVDMYKQIKESIKSVN